MKILVWGANDICLKRLKFDVNCHQLEIEALIDVNVQLWGKTIPVFDSTCEDEMEKNVPVISPDHISEYEDSYIVVLSAHDAEIRSWYEQTGLPMDRLILHPCNIFCCDDEEIFDLKGNFIERLELYRQIYVDRDQIHWDMIWQTKVLKYLSEHIDQDNCLTFGDVRIPYETYRKCPNVFMEEFRDILQARIGIKDLMPGYHEGPYEYGQVSIDKGDVVLDFGANYGIFTAMAAPITGSQGKVLAFEPVSAIRQELVKLEQLNSNVKIEPYAIYNRCGVDEIDVSNVANRPGSASLVMDKSKGGEKIVEQIKTITLDEYVKQNGLTHVDFIKADIEGSEREMLEGGMETIRKYKPKLALRTYHLPDDSKVLRHLVKQMDKNYIIIEKWKTLYAYIPE